MPVMLVILYLVVFKLITVLHYFFPGVKLWNPL